MTNSQPAALTSGPRADALKTIDDVLDASRVVPVLAFESAGEAMDVCAALVEGGLRVLEITLRHPTALESIRAVRQALPEAIVGAGTVTDPEKARRAQDAGALFGVSPGLTRSLAEAVVADAWPFLPGVASASEAMAAAELGFFALKFFPAEAAGGAPFLRSIAPVLPELRFCPTGGVTLDNAGNYLSLPNVPCVGGSWLSKRGPDGKIDPERAREAARAAAEL